MKLDFAPFVNAMNLTFSDMVGIEILNGPYEHMKGDDNLADVSVNIGLTGEVKASILLTVSESAAIMITTNTTGKENVSFRDRIVTDTMGEILNMVVGQAQRHSNHKFDFSLPIAVEGRNHSVRSVFDSDYRRVLSKMSGEEVGLYLFEASSAPG
jgi:CheY-specific phosphatase CheX